VTSYLNQEKRNCFNTAQEIINTQIISEKNQTKINTILRLLEELDQHQPQEQVRRLLIIQRELENIQKDEEGLKALSETPAEKKFFAKDTQDEAAQVEEITHLGDNDIEIIEDPEGIIEIDTTDIEFIEEPQKKVLTPENINDIAANLEKKQQITFPSDDNINKQTF